MFQPGGALGVYASATAREASGDYTSGLSALMFACLGAGALFTLLGPYRFGREPNAGRIDHAALAVEPA